MTIKLVLEALAQAMYSLICKMQCINKDMKVDYVITDCLIAVSKLKSAIEEIKEV